MPSAAVDAAEGVYLEPGAEPEGVPLEHEPEPVEQPVGISEVESKRRAQERIEAQVRMVADFWALRYAQPGDRDRFRREYVRRVTALLEWIGWEDVQLVNVDPRRLPYGVRVAAGLVVLVGGGLVIGPDGLQMPGFLRRQGVGREDAGGAAEDDGDGNVGDDSGGGARAVVDAIPDEG